MDGTWTDIYRFDLARQLPVDYVQRNWHIATRPGALFAQQLIAGRPSAGGCHRLFDRTLTWRPLDGEPQPRTLADSDALAEVLHTVFGIELSASELATVREVSGRSI